MTNNDHVEDDKEAIKADDVILLNGRLVYGHETLRGIIASGNSRYVKFLRKETKTLEEASVFLATIQALKPTKEGNHRTGLS